MPRASSRFSIDDIVFKQRLDYRAEGHDNEGKNEHRHTGWNVKYGVDYFLKPKPVR